MSVSPTNRLSAQQVQIRANRYLTAAEGTSVDDARGSDTSKPPSQDTNQEQKSIKDALNHFQWVSDKASTEFFVRNFPVIATLKASIMLPYVDTLSATLLAENVSVKNAEFLDGTKAGLLEIGNTKVLMIQNANGRANYFQINNNGTVGNEILLGDTINASGTEFGSISLVENDASTKLVVTGVAALSPHATTDLEIDASQNTLALETRHDMFHEYEFGGSQVTPIVTSQSASALWKNITLLDAKAPLGTEPSIQQAYDYYSKTVEGQLILGREAIHYGTQLVNKQNTINDDTRSLFIVRVKFNNGEGGIELFTDFMPNRTALLNDPAALADYDKQYELILSEIKSEGSLYETEQEQLRDRHTSDVTNLRQSIDPSLQVIMASGLSEAFAQSPDRVNEILTDIDSGWKVRYETDGYNGLYKTRRPLFDSTKASITYRLDALLYSYARPHDTYDVVAHEAGHSLDAQGSIKLDGHPSLSRDDANTLHVERERLFAIYNASPQHNTSGLRDYAYVNRKEFFADITMFFLSGTQGAAAIFNASPELYGVLSRFYNVDYGLI